MEALAWCPAIWAPTTEDTGGGRLGTGGTGGYRTSSLWYRTDVTLKVRGGFGGVHCIVHVSGTGWELR